MDSKERVFEEVRNWLNASQFADAFVFGSLIHDGGSQFEIDRSDIDIVATFDEGINCIDRVKCVEEALKPTHELNLKLLSAFGRADATDPITSVIPVSSEELTLGIHKSGARDFFSHNRFLSIGTGSHGKIGKSVTLRSDKNEALLDALRQAQGFRNSFLSISPSGGRKVEDFVGPDSLPKDLSRAAAQVRWVRESSAADEDRFDINEGQVYLVQLVAARRNEHERYEILFKHMASRIGGRGVSGPLQVVQQLLLWEVLFEDARDLMISKRAKASPQLLPVPAKRTLPAALRQEMLIEAGNRCSFPGCSVPLGENGIAEFAFIRHISSEGPRFDKAWTQENLVSPENLIVLCPTHHVLIDKRPDIYTVEEIEKWKKEWNQENVQFNAKNVVTLLRLLLRLADGYF